MVVNGHSNFILKMQDEDGEIVWINVFTLPGI